MREKELLIELLEERLRMIPKETLGNCCNGIDYRVLYISVVNYVNMMTYLREFTYDTDEFNYIWGLR
jgi:hypothetical protein